jgi:hypothetical protein
MSEENPKPEGGEAPLPQETIDRGLAALEGVKSLFLLLGLKPADMMAVCCQLQAEIIVQVDGKKPELDYQGKAHEGLDKAIEHLKSSGFLEEVALSIELSKKEALEEAFAAMPVGKRAH